MGRSKEGVVSNKVCSREVCEIKFYIGRKGQKSLVDNKASLKFREGLVMGVDGEREENGSLDLRGQDWTIAARLLVVLIHLDK